MNPTNPRSPAAKVAAKVAAAVSGNANGNARVAEGDTAPVPIVPSAPTAPPAHTNGAAIQPAASAPPAPSVPAPAKTATGTPTVFPAAPRPNAATAPAPQAPPAPAPAAQAPTAPAPTAPAPTPPAPANPVARPSTAAPVTAAAMAAPRVAAPGAGAPPAAAGSLGTGAPTKPAAKRAPAPAPQGRRARLTVARVDPWSVMKISFLVSVAIGIALVVMVAVLWLILDGMGVFTSVNGTIQDVAGTNSKFDLMDYIALPRVLSLSVVIGVVDVILLTALSTLSAFLYNVCSSLVGGVQLTLSDD
jgi:Transmembrane domain of unknown function (DUF3566)